MLTAPADLHFGMLPAPPRCRCGAAAQHACACRGETLTPPVQSDTPEPLISPGEPAASERATPGTQHFGAGPRRAETRGALVSRTRRAGRDGGPPGRRVFRPARSGLRPDSWGAAAHATVL